MGYCKYTLLTLLSKLYSIVCNLDLWRECILYLRSDQQHYDDISQKIVESSKFDKSCHIFVLYQQHKLYHIYIINSYRLKWNISNSWGWFRLWEYSSSLREFQSFTLDRYMSWFTQANSHEGDKLYKTAIAELFWKRRVP